ncbi:NAD(P)-bd_dom domain-containing protein, partial [Haematococcus lacustris]
MKVAVTGAGGRTGSLVVQRLSKRPGMEAIATVRSVASKTALAQKLGCPESSLRVVDIAASPSVVTEQLTAALAGCAALVIATSAVPEMLPKPEGAPPGPPSFKWKEGQAPEQVDWLGQKLQVDAAKQAG